MLALLIGAAWIAFAPMQIGGRAIYIVVDGNSMEPLYYRGDLVIAAAAADYQAGDIVTYRHPKIGYVIHRIIGRTPEGRWVFQGDNNDFIDPYEPRTDELVGRATIHIPRAGDALMFVRQSPWLLTLILLVMVMAASAGSILKQSPQKRRRVASESAADSATGWRETALAVIALVAMGALLLLGFAYTRPTTEEVNADLVYTQRGEFSYSAAASPGIYDGVAAQTGDPIFRRVSEAIDVEFRYTFESAESAMIRGTYRMVAEIGANGGWRRSIELQPQQEFGDAGFVAAGTLRLADIEALVTRFVEETGVASRQYTVAIVPEVAINGMIADRPVAEQFAPRMQFVLDELQLTLVRDDGNSGDPLFPERGGLVPRTTERPNRLDMFGLKLDVEAARRIGLGALALSILAAALIGAPLLLAAQRDEAARIKLQYGGMIVAARQGANKQEPHIDILSIEDLVKLAERLGAVIVCEPHAEHERYVVYTETVAYIYTPAVTTHAESELLETPPESPAGWEHAFLQVLREQGLATEASRAAGISLVAAYQRREASPAFASAWNAARHEYRRPSQKGAIA
jgi:signal peptidase